MLQINFHYALCTGMCELGLGNWMNIHTPARIYIANRWLLG